MEYILGSSTGLLKEVETRNLALLRLSQIDHQSLERKVTCLCWSGGFGGYYEDEITVGYQDGTVLAYNYLTMEPRREYKLDSRCIYLTMLNYHFDLFGPEIYKRNQQSKLYPEAKKPVHYGTNDRLLLSVSESGYIYVFDWSVAKSNNVAKVKRIYKTKSDLIKEKNNNESNKNNGPTEQNNVVEDKEVEDDEYVGALSVYKYKGPLSDAQVHTVMRNRLLLGGPNNPPAIFDLFSETVLWVGKHPHETVLGLQSKLDITTLCLIEEVDDDIVCVATRDSFVYIYDPKSQRDPIFEFNICDYRSVGLSKRLLALPHEDFNTKHRRILSKAINEKYSQSERAILKLATKPSYKLFFTDSQSENHDDEIEGDVRRISDSLYIQYYHSQKKDFSTLYLCDNFGTIYTLQFLTGVRLLHWIYRKIGPILDEKLGYPVTPNSNNSNDTMNNNSENKNNFDDTNNTGTSNNENKNNTDTITNNHLQTMTNNNTESPSRDPLKLSDIENLSDTDKRKIVEHLIEARKRLCTSCNNDKKVHFRRNHYSQFVCKILNCYNFHNGSVVDLKCIGNYLISGGLDRFSRVVNLRTGKLVFQMYCNQKQSCILVKNSSLFKDFEDKVEFKSVTPPSDPSEDQKEERGQEDQEGDHSEPETGDEGGYQRTGSDHSGESDLDPESLKFQDVEGDFDLDTDQEFGEFSQESDEGSASSESIEESEAD